MILLASVHLCVCTAGPQPVAEVFPVRWLFLQRGCDVNLQECEGGGGRVSRTGVLGVKHMVGI